LLFHQNGICWLILHLFEAVLESLYVSS
jgi:hypothetical protein